MKAITIQQPFAFEILSGQKTIEVRDWDTLHRGDILICASGKPAFSRDDMEEIEDEYGCSFLYGHALCLARLADVRMMRRGDEEKAMVDEIDPEAFSWVLEDVRPVVPFPVKEKKGLFEVDDALIAVSPFRYGESVIVKKGTVAHGFGIDFSGWRGRTSDVVVSEGEPRIMVAWNSDSLKNLPAPVIAECTKDGIDWTAVLLRFHELEPASPVDTVEDVQDTIEAIIEEHPEIFED